MEKTFTTFEVAKHCGVFHTTVINWVNKGKLDARVTPGGHRRIPLKVLASFMKKYDMPIPKDLAGKRASVLIVDDEPLVTRTIARILARNPSKPQVFVCHNGVEALVLVGKDMPDVLILDLLMPVMDGHQVCRILKASKITKGIKIIVVTGERLSPVKKRNLRKNCDAFFRKPFDAAELSTAVTRLLSN